MAAARATTLEIDVMIVFPRWHDVLPPAEEVCRRAATAAYQVAGRNTERAEASIVLAEDRMIRRLNRHYRGKDEATNVLSFPTGADELHPVAGNAAPSLLGDVVVAYQTTAREAAAEGKDLGDHLSHLIVHGLLHLLGYDHRDDREAEEMESLERRALAALGIADPRAAGIEQGS